MKKNLKKAFLVVALGTTLFPKEAHAYLDPNTGSYLLQIAAAAIFGGLFIVKSGWGEIKRFVTSTLLRKDIDKSEKASSNKSK
jgi:hypothetical protein